MNMLSVKHQVLPVLLILIMTTVSLIRIDSSFDNYDMHSKPLKGSRHYNRLESHYINSKWFSRCWVILTKMILQFFCFSKTLSHARSRPKVSINIGIYTSRGARNSGRKSFIVNDIELIIFGSLSSGPYQIRTLVSNTWQRKYWSCVDDKMQQTRMYM